MNRKPTKTFAQTMRAALIKAITCCAMLAAPVIGASMLPTPMQYAAPEHSDTAVADADLAPAKGTQAWVVKKTGCVRTGEGEFPKAVIISTVNKGWYSVDSDKAIGHVFEQLVFDGVIPANEWTKPVNHGIRVGVMCR